MKAIVVSRTGGPEVLEWRDRDPGAPGPGQARIAVRAAGVNYIDVYFRTGLYPRPLPFAAGLEGAGVVEALGPDVRGLAVGDRVAWASVPGSYAQAVVAPVQVLVRVPAGVSDDVAAAAMLQGMTAHYLCRAAFPVKSGDTALVHAAAGGVGLLLVQMLRGLGATVIATCSTADKEKLAREAGAAHVIRYSEVEFQPEVRRLTGGRGVDAVYDAVGRTTFEGSLRSLRPRGMLVLYGQSSGPVPPFELRQLNDLGSLFLTRPSLAHYTATREELEQRAADVLGMISRGELRLRIDHEYPLAEAAQAHRDLEGRKTAGKLLLRP